MASKEDASEHQFHCYLIPTPREYISQAASAASGGTAEASPEASMAATLIATTIAILVVIASKIH